MNYQVMNESQMGRNGRYTPDYEKLLANATSYEEREYISSIRDSQNRGEFDGFAFNMVYVTRQKCGHFEIFQSPVNKYHPLEDVLRLAEKMTKERECTRCICGWGDKSAK